MTIPSAYNQDIYPHYKSQHPWPNTQPFFLALISPLPPDGELSEEEVFLVQSPCEPDVPQQVALVLALVDGITSLPRIIKTIEVRFSYSLSLFLYLFFSIYVSLSICIWLFMSLCLFLSFFYRSVFFLFSPPPLQSLYLFFFPSICISFCLFISYDTKYSHQNSRSLWIKKYLMDEHKMLKLSISTNKNILAIEM